MATINEQLKDFYKKNNIEFIETEHGIFCTDSERTAKENYQRYLKQIDICAPKTNQELQEEIENLKAQLEAVHERLCTQQEMSSTVIAHVFGMEALKNE